MLSCVVWYTYQNRSKLHTYESIERNAIFVDCKRLLSALQHKRTHWIINCPVYLLVLKFSPSTIIYCPMWYPYVFHVDIRLLDMWLNILVLLVEFPLIDYFWGWKNDNILRFCVWIPHVLVKLIFPTIMYKRISTRTNPTRRCLNLKKKTIHSRLHLHGYTISKRWRKIKLPNWDGF